MPQVPVYNQEGESVGRLDLSDAVFGIEPRQAAVHQTLIAHLARRRAGTADTKTRGEVRGGGRKPWRQKKTGRARQGTIRAPQWKGGGTVFGPHPRSYHLGIPRKMRRLALRSVLSFRAGEGKLIVLDSLSLGEPKTGLMVKLLKSLNVPEGTLLVTRNREPNVELAVRNLPSVKVISPEGLNTAELLGFPNLVIVRDALPRIEEVFSA
ncbi:MAG: 50S ribosomal protein L4 [Firmicutes bacterium]|nr:50S ribosomal protein L4 [Bacillota bacterium]